MVLSFFFFISSSLKREHLNCSNLQNLSAIVLSLESTLDPVSVLRPFHGEGGRKVTVDVVGDNGFLWIKVVARSPKALDLNSSGGNQFGQRSFMDQVDEFLSCSRANVKMFRVPTVAFAFHNGLSEGLAKKLEKKGVRVMGQVIQGLGCPVDEEEDDDGEESNTTSEEDEDSQGEEGLFDEEGCDSAAARETPVIVCDNSRLNLDITAMIAYVSALTNGHSDHVFKEPILNEQASWERERPVKPELDRIFRGKRLVCCESAMRDFKAILGTLGGPGERLRGEELTSRVEVVPDASSERLRKLDVCRRIKERSRAIFGTGDSLGVITVTANSGFVRAARGQGLELAVALHESRALTEDKSVGVGERNED